MSRWFAGLVGVLALACGGSRAGPFQTVAELGGGFTVAVILGLEDGSAVVLGFAGGTYVPLSDRTTAVRRVESGGEVTSSGFGAGWVTAADALGEEVWAIHATPRDDPTGPEYALQISQDGGRTWESSGPIPATSLTGVTVAGDGCGWAIGVKHLLRTCDRGATWQVVQAPLFLRGIHQPLVATGRDRVVLGGAGLFRSEDAGVTWTQLAEADVVAANPHFVIAREGETLRVGALGGQTVAWVGTWEHYTLPGPIWSSGPVIRVLAAPLGDDAGRGLALLRSEDARAPAERSRIGRSSDIATGAFAHDGAVLHLDLERRLEVLRF